LRWWEWYKGARIRGKGVETGALITTVAGGQSVGHAATERAGDRVRAASTSVLEHKNMAYELFLAYCLAAVQTVKMGCGPAQLVAF